MLSQAQSRGQVADGIRQHGVAPGGRKMIDLENEAARLANETGLYVTWRSRKGGDCTRVGPGAKCFCGHKFEEHSFLSKKAVYPRCNTCPCQQFAFIPQRPEEVGDWWLPRRKGFNIHTWRAKCRCGHAHDEHDPTSRRCLCGCGMFQSNFACVVCDLKWEDHETVFETTAERLSAGLTVGEAFRPLASDRELQELVFADGGPGPGSSSRARPAQVGPRFAEKSVQIMHASSGGAIKNQAAANRWGKVENPPAEWLFDPAAPLGNAARRAAVCAASSGSKATGTAAGRAAVSSIGQASSSKGSKAVPTSVPVAGQSRPGVLQEPPKLGSGFRPIYD